MLNIGSLSSPCLTFVVLYFRCGLAACSAGLPSARCSLASRCQQLAAHTRLLLHDPKQCGAASSACAEAACNRLCMLGCQRHTHALTDDAKTNSKLPATATATLLIQASGPGAGCFDGCTTQHLLAGVQLATGTSSRPAEPEQLAACDAWPG